MIKLPSFIPELNSETNNDTQHTIGKFNLIGAITRLTYKLYNNIVSNNLISEWYAKVGRAEYAQSPHLRTYILYLIKCILNPYLGDPRKSLDIERKEIRPMDTLFPSRMAFLGLVRQRRHETLWLDSARGVILKRSAILKNVFLLLRRVDSLGIDELCSILLDLLREPDIGKMIPILKRITKRRIDISSYDYAKDSFFYEELRALVQSDASSDKEDQRAVHEEKMTTLVISSTHQYLDLGGNLEFSTPAQPQAETAHVAVSDTIQDTPRVTRADAPGEPDPGDCRSKTPGP
jgi:hypothetical protein